MVSQKRHHRISVSRKPPVFLHRTLRLPIVLSFVILLAAMVVPPVSADEPACYQKAVMDGIAVTDESNLRVSQPVEISALINTCDHCYFHWYVMSKGDYENWYTTDEYFTQTFSHTFADPGSYKIELLYGTPKPVCSLDTATTGTYSKIITVTNPCPAGRSDLTITQQTETSPVGSSSWWSAASAPECPVCSFTWSIWKITPDTWIQYPLGENDVHTENGRPELSHTFTESGDYKINVIMRNPQYCEGLPGGQYYASTTVIHHVTGTSGPSELGSGPQVFDPVPLSTTGTAAPAATVTPSQQVTRPPATYTAIPAVTQPVVTIPQGSGQPTGTPASPDTANFVPASVPGVTTAGTGDPAPGAPAAAVPAPTRTPGFELPLVLCAGLVTLVLNRK